VLFCVSLVVLAHNRITQLFFLWIPGINSVSEKITIFLLENNQLPLYIFIFLLITSGLILRKYTTEALYRALVIITIIFCLLEVIVVEPFWLISTYLLLCVVGIVVHFTAQDEKIGSLYQPVFAFLKKGGMRLFPFPILCSMIILSGFYGSQLPSEIRTVHPAPPEEFSFNGELIKLSNLTNPYRKYEKEDKEKFYQLVKEGGEIYYKNCFFCHGDKLDGNGHFARALNPAPANFRDTGTIAQLNESYVFWRVATGGRGLPEQSAPWNSAMPVWKNYLTKDEIWKVILFIYEASGQRPKGL
jgi:mono/diheme cytochrome c family protein